MTHPAPTVVSGRETVMAQAVSDLPGELGTRELIDFTRRVGVPHGDIQHAGFSCEHLVLSDAACARARDHAREVGATDIALVMDRKHRSPLQTKEATLQ